MTTARLNAHQLTQLTNIYFAGAQLFAAPSDSKLLRLLASIGRDQLAELMTELHFEPGDVVCYEGDSGDSMYLIRSGRVAIVKGDFDSPTLIGYRGPGEAVGEMALLDGQPRSASIVALEPLRLLRIDRESFHAWLTSSPDVSMSIMAALSMRLRNSDYMRTVGDQVEQELVQQVTELQSEKEHLLELQRVRQETSNLVIHDLRNPLGVIAGGLNMLEMVLPEEVLADNRDILDLAVSASDRMMRLVDSLLDVARLETGEMRLSLGATNLGTLMDEAVNRTRLAARQRQVTVHAVYPDDMPSIVIDGETIDRVLANLVDNALKYTPADGTITVAADVYDDELVLSITDTGPGIPPDQRQRIFERFAQVEGSSVAHRRRGFGLGLTFCKLAVEAHGGHIWVEEGPGGIGSRFAFSLPF
ncbi:MAG: cyclic nucleotide-binding domain-containing protein [Chloroflexi bacterium]|nr:cyclic nucleotide-binding domain-containing protein [Chloroflexota bacterium]